MIDFTVPIKAEPQGSSTGFSPLNSRRVMITSANKKLKPYRNVVASSALQAVEAANCVNGWPMFRKEKAVKLVVIFTFIKPKSAHKRVDHTVKPDLDKLVRGVNDALTGIIWHDDSQVCVTDSRKVYGDAESVYIRVEAI